MIIMDEGQLNEIPTKIVFVHDENVNNSSVMICDEQPQPHSATFTSQTSTEKVQETFSCPYCAKTYI